MIATASFEPGASSETGVTFSIVTPTYNCLPKIDATVRSVLVQSGTTWEYLVIDGASTDGTQEQLHSYGDQIRWFSEPDAGIYDAMNKGIQLAQGRFLYFLGAGDQLLDGVLAAVAASITESSLRIHPTRPTLLYGDVNWSRYQRPYAGRFNRFKLLRSNICHQAIFYERSIFSRLGSYNTEYRLFSDWAFNIRAFNDAGIDKRYLPLRVANFEDGGASNNDGYDPAFYRDFRYLVSQECNARNALLMRVAFLLAHPRALLGEPARQGRRLRERWRKLHPKT